MLGSPSPEPCPNSSPVPPPHRDLAAPDTELCCPTRPVCSIFPWASYYQVLSREGARLRSGEGRVPSNHDGMAAFAGPRGRVRLVRNHENRPTAAIPVPAVPGLIYDLMGKGGCTAIVLDARGRSPEKRGALAGTAVNCAGGPTPWGTWLSYEETEGRAGTNGCTKDHGFIFEVVGADPHRTGAVPLTAMGRFQHETIAIDPDTGIVYETEDAFERPFGLFYRFLPEKPFGGTGSLGQAAPCRPCGRGTRSLEHPGDRQKVRPGRVRTGPDPGAARSTRWPSTPRRSSRAEATTKEWGEFAGVTFSPEGRTMYVNCYTWGPPARSPAPADAEMPQAAAPAVAGHAGPSHSRRNGPEPSGRAAPWRTRARSRRTSPTP